MWLLALVGLRARRRLGVLATAGVLVLASMAIASGLVVSRQGAPLLDEVAAEASVAHLVLEGDAEAIERVASDPEVVAHSGPFAAVPDAELVLAGESVPLSVTALESPDIAVNSPPRRSGRWVGSADELVLDRSAGVDLGVQVGDDVVVRRRGRDTTFRVVGTAVSLVDCFYPQCDPARAWVTESGLRRIASDEPVSSQGWLRFEDPAQADPFVQRLAAAGVSGISSTDSWLDTREDFLVFDRVFGAFVAAFGVFVLAVAAVIIAGATAMRVVARRREIGLLGAIGSAPRQVEGAFVLENVLVGAGAGLVGWFLAGFLAPSLQLGIGRTIGPQDPSWSVAGLVICLAVVSAVLVIATIVPAVSAARRPVTDVLRDVPRERASWINRRLRDLPRRMAWIGAREVASQPTRSVLASSAIVVAVVGAVVSVGFIRGMTGVADDPARAGSPWDVALIPGETDAGAAVAAIEAVPGVDAWYPELARRSTFHDGAFLAVAMGGDPEAAAHEVAEGRPLRSTGEAIAGYGFLDRFGASVGDELTILFGTTPVTLEIVGWYRETEDSGEMLRFRVESLRGTSGVGDADVYRIVVDESTTPEAVATELAESLGPEARLETVDAGTEDIAPLMAALWLIAGVLLLMACVNLLSTLATSTRESTRRLGVELALGFTPRQVVMAGATSGVVLGASGSIVGVPVGLWTFRALSDITSTSLGVGPAWLPVPGLVAVMSIGGVVTAACGAIGAVVVGRLARTPASDLVRAE